MSNKQSQEKESNVKVALITGAAKRIGASIAKTLHDAGFNVIVHYRHSEEAANELINSLNSIRNNSATGVQGDLCDSSSAKIIGDKAIAQWGRLDALINNASTFYPTPLDQATESDWDALMGSNVKGPLFLSQTVADTLKKSNGCIVNIVDIYAEKPIPNHPIYCMAKAAVAMMTKSLAIELAPEARVNGVSPGAILWPENEISDEEKAAIVEKIPLSRAGNSSDISDLVLYLVKDAPYINGQIIAVDGGRSARY